jgi:hypothetical protein
MGWTIRRPSSRHRLWQRERRVEKGAQSWFPPGCPRPKRTKSTFVLLFDQRIMKNLTEIRRWLPPWSNLEQVMTRSGDDSLRAPRYRCKTASLRLMGGGIAFDALMIGLSYCNNWRVALWRQCARRRSAAASMTYELMPITSKHIDSRAQSNVVESQRLRP